MFVRLTGHFRIPDHENVARVCSKLDELSPVQSILIFNDENKCVFQTERVLVSPHGMNVYQQCFLGVCDYDKQGKQLESAAEQWTSVSVNYRDIHGVLRERMFWKNWEHATEAT